MSSGQRTHDVKQSAFQQGNSFHGNDSKWPEGVDPANNKDGLSDPQVEELREKYGANEVKTKQEPEWRKIARRYYDWVSLLIIAAAIVSAAVPVDGGRGWASFGLLVFELNLIVWVGYYSDRNAGNAIKELEELSAPTAMVKRNGKWGELAVKELVLGDLLELKGGDIIPADCRLIGKGDAMKIDESSLTGESLPVTRGPGETVLSGASVTQGELEAVVTAVGPNTFFGKTIALLGAPEERGHLQKVMSKVTVALALFSFVCVLAILIVLLARGEPVGYCFVVFFVVFVSVVPIGMPVVTTTVLAIGAKEMVAEKAIVNRLSALEELSGMEVLASDKTGTLTLNKLSLDKEDIEAAGGRSADDVLLAASLSAKWDNADAIDTAVTAAVGGDKKAIEGYEIKKFTPFNPVDKKTTAVVVTPDSRELHVAKGAPQIIGETLADAGERQAVDAYIAERASRGLRAIGVAESSDGGATWALVGLISLLDPPRPDSAATIKRAQELGVEVKMVTGDQLAIAVETSRRLGLGTNIMEGKQLMASDAVDAQLAHQVNQVDGFAGVYPEHKHRIVEALQGKGRLVGMTGDGVNDAPALKKANVGIAVAGATAAAKGAADITLTQEGIGTIITAISRSRMIFRRLETYILYRIASSLLILGFFFFAIIILRLEMPTWVLVIISITNDMSAMFTSFDKVHTSAMPELWNMEKCLAVAIAQAIVGVGGTVLFLVLASIDRANWWHLFNIRLNVLAPENSFTEGEVVAVMYLCLTALIQLNLLATRNPSFWWRFGSKTAPRPSLILLAPVAAFLLAATFIAVYWPARVEPDQSRGSMDGAGWAAVGITWAYVFVWWQLADLAKVIVQKIYRTADGHREACKREETPLPGWVAALDRPAEWADTASDRFTTLIAACWAPVARCCGLRERFLPISRQEMQSEMSSALSLSRMSGIDVNELRAMAQSPKGGRKSEGGRSRKSMDDMRRSTERLGAVAVNLPPNNEDTAYGRAAL
jgi:H+-transporting ATPase